jgi:hypothetical protein
MAKYYLSRLSAFLWLCQTMYNLNAFNEIDRIALACQSPDAK